MSFPFLVFALPLVQDWVTHVKPTGYDRSGKCVPKMSVALHASAHHGVPPLFPQVRQGGDRGARAGGESRGALAQQRWLLRRRVPRLMTTDEPPTVGSQRGAAMGTVEDESGSQRRCGA